MARLALIFTVFILGVLQFYVRAESPETDPDALLASEESVDRNAYASAQAFALGAKPIVPSPQPVPRPIVIPQRQVECVTCSGCPKAANATTKYCPYSPDPLKNGKCVVYSEKYYHMKKPWVIRGCASERGNCADVKAALFRQSNLVKLLSCADCEGDRCNGAAHSLPDLMSALTAILLSPLLMKYTLS